MKNFKKIVALLISITLLAAGCGLQKSSSEEEKETTKKAENKKITKEESAQAKLDVVNPAAYNNAKGLKLEKGTYISIIGKASTGEYWGEVKKGVEKATDDINENLGYTGKDKVKITFNAPADADDVDQQVNLLDEELAREPAALAISIADEQSCKVQFDMAADNEIPIVAYDCGSDYQGLMATVSTDNTKSAKEAADKLAEAMSSKGKVLILAHDSKSMAAKERVAGFKAELKKKYPKMSVANVYYMDNIEKLQKNVAAEINTGTYARSTDGDARLRTGDEKINPTDITEDDIIDYYLQKHPDVCGCFATNATAVKTIVSGMDRTKKDNVMVVGYDADKEEIDMLKKGKVDGLVVQNPYAMGYASVIAAARSALSMGNESVVDTGYTWITKSNLNDNEVKKMLYNE